VTAGDLRWELFAIGVTLAVCLGCAKPSAPSAPARPQGAITSPEGAKLELAQGLTEADLGVPFYPGSVPQEEEGLRLESEGESIVAVSRYTPDLPERVVEFYRGVLGEPSLLDQDGAMTRVEWKQPRRVELRVVPGPDKTGFSLTVVK